MVSLPCVQRMAYDREFFELVLYLEEHPKDYVRYILTGKSELDDQ